MDPVPARNWFHQPDLVANSGPAGTAIAIPDLRKTGPLPAVSDTGQVVFHRRTNPRETNRTPHSAIPALRARIPHQRLRHGPTARSRRLQTPVSIPGQEYFHSA